MASLFRHHAVSANPLWLAGVVVLVLASTGCVQRNGGLSIANSTYPTSDGSAAGQGETSVDAAELAQLADRLGLGGRVPVVVARPRIATAPRNRQRTPFVQVNRNGTFPGSRSGNGSFAGGGNGSFPRGTGNGSFASGEFGNGTFASGGGRGTFPQGGGNTTFGTGGGIGSGDGRFVPIRRGGSSTFPAASGNTTFGSEK